MAELVRKRAVKLRRKMKKEDVPAKIEKKPLTPRERRLKLRKDLLRIARRYEDMQLYDDAMTYYKKLGKHDDVERLVNIKEEKYLKKAQEFEAAGKYEDALRLYENLKMTEEVERLNRLLGKETIVDEKPAGTTIEPVAQPEEEFAMKTEDEYAMDLGDEDEPERELEEPAEIPAQPPEKLEYYKITKPEPEPEKPQHPPKTQATTAPSEKVFKICPYCGEELNLPKKPNFCPYCTERLA